MDTEIVLCRETFRLFTLMYVGQVSLSFGDAQRLRGGGDLSWILPEYIMAFNFREKGARHLARKIAVCTSFSSADSLYI